ncbi:MAG: hypothetical protein ACOY5R_00985 [Pseudomonadota bacterium]
MRFGSDLARVGASELGLFRRKNLGSGIVAGLVAAAALASATPGFAASKIKAEPVKAEGQTIRYEKGTPTIEDDLEVAAVRVMPLKELDHGSMQFKVVVFNKSKEAINVGVENVSAAHNGTALAVFSVEQLEKKAKSRTMWSQIGYAMLAGAAAAAQNNNTTYTTYTPRGGVYRTVVDRPGLSTEQVVTVAAGGGAIALSQIGLQKTLEALNDEILQTTTVDPQAGYGGKVIIEKLKRMQPGDTVAIEVTTGSERHLFKFAVSDPS